MEQTGKLVTCDRCQKTIFLKCVGEGEADGGYTRWNKFEQLPKGWERQSAPTDKISSRIVMLCSECNAEYKKIIDKFIAKEKEFLRNIKEL